jgi:hypothetical protein
MRIDLLLVFAAFAAGTLVALALGAINTGTAMTFGQLAFAGAVVWVLAKRP